MSSRIETKIGMKRATQISLSDQFAQYQKVHPQSSTVSEIRAKMRSAVHASQANRRLAQQLANRPSLQEALGNLNKMSVEQQLGQSNVKARLSHNDMTGVGGHQGGLGRGSGQGGGLGGDDSCRRNNGGQSVLRGSPSAGNASEGIFLSPSGDFHGNIPSLQEALGNLNKMSVEQQLGQSKYRGVSRGGIDGLCGDLRDRGENRERAIEAGSFQIAGTGGVRGKSRGRGVKLHISKQEIDNELEQYMSNAKAKLDKNVDAYIGSSSAGNAREGRFLSPYGDFQCSRGRRRIGVMKCGIDDFGGDLRGRIGNRDKCVERGSFQRGGRGGVRGQSRRRGTKLISKEDLDKQLDEYMSNTKVKLGGCIYRPS